MLPRSFSSRHENDLSMSYSHLPPHHAPPSYRETDDDIPPATPTHHEHPTSSYHLPPLDTTSANNQVGLQHSSSNRTTSTITPGADYLGVSAVGGGISGVALGVASQHQRDSGLEATRNTDAIQNAYSRPRVRDSMALGTDSPYVPEPPRRNSRIDEGSWQQAVPMSVSGEDGAENPFMSPPPSRHSTSFSDERAFSSPTSRRPAPEAFPATRGIQTNAHQLPNVPPSGPSYSDNPYNQYSSAWDPRVSTADFDPEDIDDEEDVIRPPASKRRSVLGINSNMYNNEQEDSVARGPRAGAIGGMFGALQSLAGRKITPISSTRQANGQYGPLGDFSMSQAENEKSEWLDRETSRRKRLRWLVGAIIAILIIGAVIGGLVGGLRHSRENSGDKTEAPVESDDDHKDLSKDSPEIKNLMNNPGLHKVLPGIDYTPFNGQYPDCLTNPPSQSNVTRDIAVLSQLSNTVRLYGTDCNQTEMVLHAVDRLSLTGFKVWLGVWLDGNQTTVDRGIDAMHDLLTKYGSDPFAGVVVGNEVLFRKDMSADELGQILQDTKDFMTAHKISLPLATSDLGDAWTSALASKVDVVMANVHPFFAGVTADIAAGWTYDFFTGHDASLTQGTNTKAIISEVGWPSAGGINCPPDQTTCTQGSKAGIPEMNEFMSTFICQSLANNTDFFWFEAFDEPWKERLNEPGKEWEDKWGLMDSGRKLKPGLKIPDCGGKGIS